MASHSSHVHTDDEVIAPANTKRIWTVFWILLIITSIEFIIAFAKGPMGLPHSIVVAVFVGLTIVKAFYIVAEFMHLKHEVKILVYCVIIPFSVFVTWFITAMLIEGSYTNKRHVNSKMTNTIQIQQTK